jgi:hypothetical protein
MRQSRAAVIRRRRLSVTVTVVVVATAAAVLATQLPAHSHTKSSPPAGTHSTSPSAALQSSAAAPNPHLLHHLLASYIATRHGAISVAVYDSVTKHALVVNPAVRGRTASIVKVDILETLLHLTGGHLS